MAGKKTLLVLEEGEKLTRGIKPEFERAGYEVITYRDATGVLVMAKQIAADVMILDAQLRNAGSLSALKSFGRNVHTAAIPIIALVGRTGPKSADLMAAGARACIDDPASAKDLVALAEKHRLEELDFTAMPPAAKTEALNEPARVQAVEKARVLGTPPDIAYDRVTRLATRLTSAPASVASYITADRQFIKSHNGFEGKWERDGQPLSHSFCQWVVSSREPVVIEDSRRHRVLRSNAAVKDLGVIAYAGVPIVGEGGEAIGSMCTFDQNFRQWKREDVETLQDLALVLNAYAVRVPERVRDAILASTRTLRRYGSRLADTDREELLQIIDEQSTSL